MQEAGKIEVSVATIDGQSITVATALRLALDAFPNINAEDSAGMPLAMTNATLLDFLVEDDGILITTRLKALTYKETRVYSIKNLKNANPTELSKVICQSIRPWSWRSRIDELGEQLKSGVSNIPPSMFASLMKSGMEIATEETGIAVDASEKTDAAKPESPKTDEKKAGPSEEAQEAAMLGTRRGEFACNPRACVAHHAGSGSLRRSADGLDPRAARQIDHHAIASRASRNRGTAQATER